MATQTHLSSGERITTKAWGQTLSLAHLQVDNQPLFPEGLDGLAGAAGVSKSYLSKALSATSADSVKGSEDLKSRVLAVVNERLKQIAPGDRDLAYTLHRIFEARFEVSTGFDLLTQLEIANAFLREVRVGDLVIEQREAAWRPWLGRIRALIFILIGMMVFLLVFGIASMLTGQGSASIDQSVETARAEYRDLTAGAPHVISLLPEGETPGNVSLNNEISSQLTPLLDSLGLGGKVKILGNQESVIISDLAAHTVMEMTGAQTLQWLSFTETKDIRRLHLLSLWQRQQQIQSTNKYYETEGGPSLGVGQLDSLIAKILGSIVREEVLDLKDHGKFSEARNLISQAYKGNKRLKETREFLIDESDLLAREHSFEQAMGMLRSHPEYLQSMRPATELTDIRYEYDLLSARILFRLGRYEEGAGILLDNRANGFGPQLSTPRPALIWAPPGIAIIKLDYPAAIGVIVRVTPRRMLVGEFKDVMPFDEVSEAMNDEEAAKRIVRQVESVRRALPKKDGLYLLPSNRSAPVWLRNLKPFRG